MSETAYFLTVDWCGKGHRGVFCSKEGASFRKEDSPHSEDEMFEILGVFDMILNPQSLPFTEEELSFYTRFIPLAEYSHQYGYALKPEEG